jgi:hypothetical protein
VTLQVLLKVVGPRRRLVDNTRRRGRAAMVCGHRHADRSSVFVRLAAELLHYVVGRWYVGRTAASCMSVGSQTLASVQHLTNPISLLTLINIYTLAWLGHTVGVMVKRRGVLPYPSWRAGAKHNVSKMKCCRILSTLHPSLSPSCLTNDIGDIES